MRSSGTSALRRHPQDCDRLTGVNLVLGAYAWASLKVEGRAGRAWAYTDAQNFGYRSGHCSPTLLAGSACNLE